MTWLFWLSAGAVAYAYAGYPLVVWALARRHPADPARGVTLPDPAPAVTMIVPVHNERARIADKIANTRSLDYPGVLRVVFVSDGSSDGTVDVLREAEDERIRLIVLQERGGKAGALNAGLAAAETPLVVFTDASIMLERDAIRAIVRPFGAAAIGCVSGEDRIEGSGGEGVYGRYEMFLRRQESRLASIVGASGSFYAQRRALCGPFPPNLAPDFYSVLRTVAQGARAISEPAAVGYMRAVDDPRDEFSRKVRTLLRGLTTLGAHPALLNPMVHGTFAWLLFSHKLMRWLVPFFLLSLLAANLALAGSPFYAVLLAGQAAFYTLAWLAYRGAAPAMAASVGRIAGFFTAANVATLVAWGKYVRGTRQELWSPSKR